MVFNQMRNSVNTTVHRTLITSFIITKINLLRQFTISCHINRMLSQLVNTFVFNRGYRNNRHPKQMLHTVNINCAAVELHLIHHIKRNHHRNIQIQQLQSQKQITLNIRSINNINNGIRLFIKQKISGNHFFVRIRRQGINPRQIGNKHA